MMNGNRLEALIGFIVLAVALVFFMYLTRESDWFGDESGFEIAALFDSAQGVSAGTQVRMAGVEVGNVSRVLLDPQTYYARVEMNVAEGIEIPDDSQAVVTSEGILGGQFIEISPGGSIDMLTEGGIITDTQGYRDLMSSLTEILAR